jgi:hypothetical protein
VSWVPVEEANTILREHHYLGAVRNGFAWKDGFGVMVFAAPRSRRLPLDWLELTRWCILSQDFCAGSRQFKAAKRALMERRPAARTLVSYSDPSAGHSGALYRACNWWWAPTWLRLRPPPSGNGAWTAGKQEAVKDRWVFPLRSDPARQEILVARDEAVLRKHPEWRYREPGGVSWKTRPEEKGLL